MLFALFLTPASGSSVADPSCVADGEEALEQAELGSVGLQDVSLLQARQDALRRKAGCAAPVGEPQIGLLVAASAYPPHGRGAHVQTNLSVYQHSYRARSENVVDAEDELNANGYTLQKKWTKTTGVVGTTTFDEDESVWWANGGKCVVAFRGSDSYGDFGNNYNPTPVTMYGVDGVHAGIVEELSGLLDLMTPDLQSIKDACTDSLMVAGHSLGGGVAQLFTVVVNKADDPLNAGLTVDSLYTFGAMPVANHKLQNDKTADGCFPGALYYNARYYNAGEGPGWYNPPGGYPYLGADIVKAATIGGSFNMVMKADKVLMVDENTHILYECGKLLSDIGPAKGMVMHPMPIYEHRLGCSGLVP
jgi:hypothetical protein